MFSPYLRVGLRYNLCIIGLFERVGLLTNTSKTKAEVCIDGNIRTRLSEESYFRSRAGFVAQKQWEKRRLECDICNLDLAASSLSNHLVTQHDVYRSKVINQDLLVEPKNRRPIITA